MADGLTEISWRFKIHERVADCGVIALGERGDVVQANARALDELRRSAYLAVVDGRLCAVNPEVRGQFERLVDLCSTTSLPENRPATPTPAAAVAGPPRLPPQLKLLLARCAPNGHSEDSAAKTIVVFGTGEQAYQRLEQVMLQVQTGMTDDCAKVVMGLSQGMSVREYVQTHERPAVTVRFHMREALLGIEAWCSGGVPQRLGKGPIWSDLIPRWLHLMTASRFELFEDSPPDRSPPAPTPA